jgi:RNA polymerase sigma factor (sigma-70 family)
VSETPRKVSETPRKEARFRRLYVEHYRALLAYALRRSPSEADAQELVAEAFLVLWRRIDKAPEAEDALPWLFGVARRVLANQERARRRRERLENRLRALPEHLPELEAGVLERLEAQAVVDALSALNGKDREVLLLAAWEGLSTREIALALGCSENAATLRLHRARKRLAEVCEKENDRAEHNQDEPPSVGENYGDRTEP